MIAFTQLGSCHLLPQALACQGSGSFEQPGFSAAPKDLWDDPPCHHLLCVWQPDRIGSCLQATDAGLCSQTAPTLPRLEHEKIADMLRLIRSCKITRAAYLQVTLPRSHLPPSLDVGHVCGGGVAQHYGVHERPHLHWGGFILRKSFRVECQE